MTEGRTDGRVAAGGFLYADELLIGSTAGSVRTQNIDAYAGVRFSIDEIR